MLSIRPQFMLFSDSYSSISYQETELDEFSHLLLLQDTSVGAKLRFGVSGNNYLHNFRKQLVVIYLNVFYLVAQFFQAVAWKHYYSFLSSSDKWSTFYVCFTKLCCFLIPPIYRFPIRYAFFYEKSSHIRVRVTYHLKHVYSFSLEHSASKPSNDYIFFLYLCVYLFWWYYYYYVLLLVVFWFHWCYLVGIGTLRGCFEYRLLNILFCCNCIHSFHMKNIVVDW